MRPLLAGAATAILFASPALADFIIRGARIAEGDLFVLGQVDEPNTAITLDDSYTEKTDHRGRFQFRIAYHPATCTVLLKTERQSRAVVIANCGQRGSAGADGAQGPPGVSPPAVVAQPRQSETPSEVSCGARGALYVGANGFRLWVTRKGSVRQTNSLKPGSTQEDVVLQVSISGSTASLHGPNYTNLLRGGLPQEIETAAGRTISWEARVEALPGSIQVVSDFGTGVLAKLEFKECGNPPRAPQAAAPKPANPANPSNPTSPAPAADAGASAPPPLPLPQGALR